MTGSRDGAVVRALASHQRGPGSIPGPGVICGLSLLVVLRKFHLESVDEEPLCGGATANSNLFPYLSKQDWDQ